MYAVSPSDKISITRRSSIERPEGEGDGPGNGVDWPGSGYDGPGTDRPLRGDGPGWVFEDERGRVFEDGLQEQQNSST